MNDSIGTNGTDCWRERAEIDTYEHLCGAIESGDYIKADKWLELLERLSDI